MSSDLAVPHDKRVRAHLVHVVGSLCGPSNVSVIAFDELLLHAERSARFSELRHHRLEKLPDRIVSPERSVRCEQDSTRRIIR